jgi:hypothetical protein
MEGDVWNRIAMIEAARVDCRSRGCTCGDRALIVTLGDSVITDADVALGIYHLACCPLWVPRDLRNLPPDTQCDSIVNVELPDIG